MEVAHRAGHEGALLALRPRALHVVGVDRGMGFEGLAEPSADFVFADAGELGDVSDRNLGSGEPRYLLEEIVRDVITSSSHVAIDRISSRVTTVIFRPGF